ncbi:serine hydrolase [uncultured Nitratireductor sp.]|uniref:serine hydrolase n=1 Tax=uncultured Nitratireductor sp. TaxID=520953 RepID=UPI0025E86411|nr:serine hydrolase [uncultured Nitratireductor sp.]
MIVWSSNMATNYVIDLITETTGDTLLDSDALTQWMEKRNETNRFFRRLGWEEFATSNIAQKLMDDTRYGREAQFAGRKGENLNVLTPLVAARAFHELFDGIIPLSAESRVRAMDTLRRNPDAPDAALPGYQLREYLGGGIPAGVPIWSKAGRNSWTGDANASYFKHDLVRLAPANADPMIIALMTQGKSLCDDLPMAFPEMGQIIFETFSDATSR